jgi:hypothetical protein
MLKAQRRKRFIDVRQSETLITSFDYVRLSPFEIAGRQYQVKATSILVVSFSLFQGDDAVVVEKTKSILTNAQQIEHAGKTWQMKPAHYFSRRFNVSTSDDVKIGAVAPKSYFFPLSDITVDLPDDVPALVQVFMLWLAVRSWTADTGSGS